jgi:hypothetical protein
MDTSANLHGEIDGWPDKDRMAAILRDAGLQVCAGRSSIRVLDCSHFVFQEYGGDLGDPSIEADADSTEAMIGDAKRVSHALSRADVRHRFEIYDHGGGLVAYLHHRWPTEPTHRTS